MIREAISQVVERRDLSADMAHSVMLEMMRGDATPSQVASFVTAMRMKGETKEELKGLVMAMREKAVKVVAPTDAVDLCGTGGDGSCSFNISTAASFVVAGAGVPVAKHGNRSISSRSGSADVLDALGVPSDLGPIQVEACIGTTGLGFMFAPLFHESMRNVMIPRREIGMRTVFNVLGPMTNPAGVKNQLIGVYDQSVAEKMAKVLLDLGSSRVMVVNGCGMDEVTNLGDTRIVEGAHGQTREYDVSPGMFGLDIAEPEEIRGGDSLENARIILSVLKGERSPRSDIVSLNAAAALYISGKVPSIHDGLDVARKIIADGKALAKLREFSDISRALEIGRQRLDDVSRLRARRVQASVLVERASELSAGLMADISGIPGGSSRLDALDEGLLRQPSVLSVIVLNRILRILQSKPSEAEPLPRSQKSLSESIEGSDGIGMIAEYKPNSPSSPPLMVPPRAEDAARVYSSMGLTGVSVLVEPDYFSGSPELFSFFRSRVMCPMLFKDFVICADQVELASRVGADAVLLIAKALKPQALDALAQVCNSRGMEPLVEVHDADDLSKLTKCRSFDSIKMIGVNSRDLRNLKTDLDGIKSLRESIPDDKIVIAESGVRSESDLYILRGFDAVLIGSSFMQAEDLDVQVGATFAACRRIGR